MYGVDAALRDENGKTIKEYCVSNSSRKDITSWVDPNGDKCSDLICDNVDGGHDIYLSYKTHAKLIGTKVGPGWCYRKNGRYDITSYADLNGDGMDDIICNN